MHIEFNFFVQFWASNNMSTDSSIFLGLRRLTQLKGANRSRIPKFELSYFLSNCNAVFLQNGHLYLLFYLEKRSKTDPNSEISHIWNSYFLTLEIIKQDKCPKYSWSSKLWFQHISVFSYLPCQAKYCIHTWFLYTTFSCQHTVTISCSALCSPL